MKTSKTLVSQEQQEGRVKRNVDLSATLFYNELPTEVGFYIAKKDSHKEIVKIEYNSDYHNGNLMLNTTTGSKEELYRYQDWQFSKKIIL